MTRETCKVTKLAESPPVDGRRDKSPWTGITPLTLGGYMGTAPEHRPLTHVWIAYDAEAIRVLFHVADRYVRAAETRLHGNVCHDSCVEFFFTPGEDLSVGYFNVEINAGGTMLLHHQKEGGTAQAFSPEHCARVEIAHSLPSVIDPELAEPTEWTLEYRLPIDILEAYSPVTPPAAGAVWRANFYKCGDRTSHPHWLTWSPVDFPRPRFHLPEFFGILEFE